MNRRFLSVGINHFNTPGNDLAGCVPDCHAMQAVALFLGITADALTDQAATKKNIMMWLTDAVEQAKAGKLTYIGYAHSGHGTHYPRPAEPDGLGEAIVCYDIAELNGDWDPATIIKDTELRDLLNQVPQTCIVEVWADTCYSGGLDRAFLKKHGSTTDYRFMHNPSNTTKVLRVANSNMNQGLNPNIIMWCAASESQTAADAYIQGGAHGAFTWYWTQAYKNKPKESRLQLLLDSRKGLQAGGYDQLPRLKAWNKEVQQVVGK